MLYTQAVGEWCALIRNIPTFVIQGDVYGTSTEQSYLFTHSSLKDSIL